MAPTWIKIVPATAAALAAVVWWGHREPAAAPIERPLAAAVHHEAPPPNQETTHRDEELWRELSALKGKGAMGAQSGGDFDDFEIARAVVHMANAGGAKFADPVKPAPAAKP